MHGEYRFSFERSAKIVVPYRLRGAMTEWALRPKDLKGYPHFDGPISTQQATEYASDPAVVRSHAFYPFFLYREAWTKFAKKGVKGKVKSRPIRYGARRDAYIFTRYRHLLAVKYEEELAARGLQDNVLAYRRIKNPQANGGKCNIHFAQDAIRVVQQLGNCAVVAIDISSFFESLDHALLKAAWERTLGVPRLPEDHFAVFRAITRYSFVEKEAVYERLGHYGPKRKTASGKQINGYTTPRKDVPVQLCTGAEFRSKILDAKPRIVETNYKPYGVPQGAPLSDLLANLYMLDFDILIRDEVEAVGGQYFRYSDDVLIIVPGGEAEAHAWLDRCAAVMPQFGAKLEIKPEKAVGHVFTQNGRLQDCERVFGTSAKNGMEYLGFRYSGRGVYLRDGTLSRLFRKVTMAARREANAEVRRYPDRDAAEIKAGFNYEKLIARFGRVQDFDEKEQDYRSWTFWTYVTRAAEVFGPEGDRIRRQLRRHRERIKARANLEIDSAIRRRARALGA